MHADKRHSLLLAAARSKERSVEIETDDNLLEIDDDRLCAELLAADLAPDVNNAHSQQSSAAPFQPQSTSAADRNTSAQQAECMADVAFESAKVKAVLAELHHTANERAEEKTVVFSQFSRFLDILEHHLTDGGLRFTRLDGSMSRDVRADNLRAFHQQASIKVLLTTLKSGGMGLNLVVANNVLLTDPWWNTAAEQQAMDRVHRVGQTRPVRVVRFVTRKTVEERVTALQRKKTAMITAAMQQQISPQDLQDLFRDPVLS